MAQETPTWLKPCFVEKILQKSEGDNSIQVIDISSKPATNKGDNYTSDMIRVNIEFSREKDGRRTTEKKSIIIKLSPIAEGARKDFVLKSCLFDTEILMMTDTLNKMNKLLASKHRLSAKGLYVQKESPILLVIEDLAPLGFRMANHISMTGLDLDHCILALRGLARFHASSVAICEQEPKYKQLCSRGIFNDGHSAEMRTLFNSSVKFLAAEMKNWPELNRYVDKIDKLTEHIYKIGIDACRLSKDEFNVINHGDLHAKNMLFKYDNGKPIDYIFVDFQLCVYTSPAIDLLYFLNTSPSPDVIENSRSVLLNEYHSTLASTMQQLNCKTPPPTTEELKAALKRRARLGMIAAFVVFPMVLCPKDDLRDFDEMNGTFSPYAYKSELYRKLITKRMPLYDEWGFLDI